VSPIGREERVRRARALLSAGDRDGAETIARELLASRAKDDQALALMGSVAGARGEHAAAADWFAQAVRAERRQPRHHARLGDALLRDGRVSEALASYERALKIKPDLLGAVAGKANVLLRRRKTSAALRSLAPHLHGTSTEPVLITLAARAHHQDGDHETVKALAAEHLPRPDLHGAPRRALLLVLGGSLDRLGETDAAFAAFAEGNALDAPPFDPTAIERRLAATAEMFAPPRRASLARATIDDPLPVFVVGLPRGGSTLIEQIIHAHPAAHGAGEIHDLARLARALPERVGASEPAPACLAAMSTEQANEAATDYLQGLRSRQRRVERIVDKSLENYEHVGLILHLLPAARIIHARRDPMDTCLSIFMNDLVPAQHPYASRLEDIGRFYRAYDRIMARWREVAGGAMLEVDYEAVVADQENVSRRIIEFIGLDWDDRCLRFHEARRDVTTLSYDQVRRPIYHSAVARHVRYAAHLGPLRDALGDLAPTPDQQEKR
jgi:tetratricopeptide (TPR) repeat protein